MTILRLRHPNISFKVCIQVPIDSARWQDVILAEIEPLDFGRSFKCVLMSSSHETINGCQ
jgi:hypothetical protein